MAGHFIKAMLEQVWDMDILIFLQGLITNLVLCGIFVFMSLVTLSYVIINNLSEELLIVIDLEVSVDPFNLILIKVVTNVLLPDELQELFMEGMILHLLAYLSEGCKVERALSRDVELEALLKTEDPTESRSIHSFNYGSEIIVVV